MIRGEDHRELRLQRIDDVGAAEALAAGRVVGDVVERAVGTARKRDDGVARRVVGLGKDAADEAIVAISVRRANPIGGEQRGRCGWGGDRPIAAGDGDGAEQEC